MRQLKVFSSVALLLASMSCLIALQWRWRIQARISTSPLELRTSIREGRWSHICSLLLGQATDAILGAGSQRVRSFWRSMVFGTALLVFMLSMTGLMTGYVLGLSDWPWNLFGHEMELLQRASGNPESMQIRLLAIEARTWPWKIVYTAVSIPLITLICGTTFWASLRSTRFFVRELETTQSWAQRAGLMLGLCVLALFLANVTTFLVSALSSLNPLLMIVLAKLELSEAFLILGGVGINAFTLYVSDPWLKGLMVAALFPSLIQLALTVPALAAEFAQSAFRRSRTTATASVRKRLRGVFIPALMIISAGLFAFWLLSKIT